MEPVSRRHSKGSIIWRFFIAYIVVIVMVLLIISPICVTLPQVTYRNLLPWDGFDAALPAEICSPMIRRSCMRRFAAGRFR